MRPKYPNARQFLTTAVASLALTTASCEQQQRTGGMVPLCIPQKDKPLKGGGKSVKVKAQQKVVPPNEILPVSPVSILLRTTPGEVSALPERDPSKIEKKPDATTIRTPEE